MLYQQDQQEQELKISFFQSTQSRHTLHIFFEAIRRVVLHKQDNRQHFLNLHEKHLSRQKTAMFSRWRRSFVFNRNVVYLTSQAILTEKNRILREFFDRLLRHRQKHKVVRQFVDYRRLKQQKRLVLAWQVFAKEKSKK